MLAKAVLVVADSISAQPQGLPLEEMDLQVSRTLYCLPVKPDRVERVILLVQAATVGTVLVDQQVVGVPPLLTEVFPAPVAQEAMATSS